MLMSDYQFTSNQFKAEIKRAVFLKSENMTAFDQQTGMTVPRVSNTYEAVLFTDDGGYFVVDSKRYEIKKGTVRFLRPGQTVYSKKYGDVFVVYFSFVYPDGNVLNEIPNRFLCSDYNRVVNLYKNIIRCYINRSGANELQMYSSLLELLFLFCSDADKHKNNYFSQGTKISSVRNALSFIDNNYRNQIDLTDVANAVNLHPNYLHRIFKQTVGKTPLEYLTETRMKKAEDYLLTTSLPVVEISQNCGFDSVSYFIYVFKRYFGFTPNKFRAEHSNDALL